MERAFFLVWVVTCIVHGAYCCSACTSNSLVLSGK